MSTQVLCNNYNVPNDSSWTLVALTVYTIYSCMPAYGSVIQFAVRLWQAKVVSQINQ
jgi:hypothetical protein